MTKEKTSYHPPYEDVMPEEDRSEEELEGLNEEPTPPEAEPAQTPPVQIVITIHDQGFSFQIPLGINPVNVAGIGWQLTQMAEMMLIEQMSEQAAQQERMRVLSMGNRAQRRVRN